MYLILEQCFVKEEARHTSCLACLGTEPMMCYPQW